MRWYGGSIVEAVNLSKKRNAIFVVYVEGDDAQSKAMTELIDSPEVSSRLGVEENFVAIKLISGSEAYTQFAQIYQLVPVPSIFFIGTTGTPLEVVAGSTAGGVSGLSSRIDNLTANKVGKTPSPTQLSEPAPSGAPATSSSTASSAFLAAEQGAIPKNKVWTEPAAKTAQPAPNAKEEFDVVCEGEVCVRRPRLPSPVTSEGDIPTPSTNTSASTSIASPTSTAAAAPPPTSTTAAPPTTSTAAASTTSSSSKPVATPAAELNIDDKVERAKELIEKKRLEKMEEERKAEIEKELERRAQGAGMAELKRWQQEQEMKTLKEERMKEKKENEKIRARILEQIAQDRLDRQGKFGSPSDAPKPASPTTPTAPSPPADTSNVTRIQFKMPDGQTHTTSVSSESTLGELRQYVRDNVERSGNFSLSTLYPRRCLTQAEDGQSMRALGLSPNSAILLLRGDPDAPPTQGSSVSKMGGFFGMLTSIFWSCVVNPANDLFRYVSNLITGQRARGRSSPDVTPGPPQGAGAATGGAQRRPTQQEDSAVKRRKMGGENSGSGMSTVRKDGNTYRLKDRDSDDENNTWNGNSTQQM